MQSYRLMPRLPDGHKSETPRRHIGNIPQDMLRRPRLLARWRVAVVTKAAEGFGPAGKGRGQHEVGVARM
jgi:hypothetical protein